MKKYTLVLIIALSLTLMALLQGCAKVKLPNANKGKGSAAATAVAPARIKAVPPGGAITGQTALLAANVAFYYGFSALHTPNDFSSMLKQDGGCQMASDFSTAIGTNDLISSTIASCTSLQISCTRATADAQKIIADMLQLNQLCDSGTGDQYFGNEALARDLFTVSQAFRADLGQPAVQ